MRRAVGATPPDRLHLGPAVRTALLVGAILTYLNTTGATLASEAGWPLLKRYAFNCLVPFSVSLYSQWSTNRRRRATADREPSARGN